jgi:arylsulfatase A-like enzyme
MTGLSPATSGIYANNQDWRQTDSLRSITTLPQHFRSNGYKVIGGGKLYHAANLSKKMLEGYLDARPWDEYFPSKQRQLADDLVPANQSVNGSNKFYGGRFEWDALEISDEEMGDGKVVAWAEKKLSQKHDKPLFLAVGIYRPHIPWYTPKAWFQKYPLAKIRLPDDPAADLRDIPETAVNTVKRTWHHWLVENQKWKDATQAYLASVSFADAMLGRLIKSLDDGPLAKNTVIVLWSDHGYHLGEKGMTGKTTLWERSTRVPVIFAGPGIKPGVCDEPAELLDLYPTLVELIDAKVPEHVEGISLLPQLNDPAIKRRRPAVTTHNPGNFSVRGKQYRLIHYADGSEELYDLKSDPAEQENLIIRPESKSVAERLRKWVPSEYAGLAEGSKHRVLEKRNDGWYWEGELIPE